MFPLRGVILLPRAELPLNVFEPRYLAMIDDAMSGNRVIGVVQPEQTAAPIESPAGKIVRLKQIGSCGRITGYQELSDGRLQIVLTGVARFVLGAETETDLPYRLASVDYRPYAADLAADDSVETVDRETLMGVLKAFLAVRRLGADWDAISRAPLEPLVNGLSAMSPFGPEEKQALLEAKDLKARADVLMALAEMAIASGGTGGGSTLQ
jgi:Lon protease-like protein